MKKATIELIKKKFEKDMWKIQDEINDNKRQINKLAQKQKELKQIRKGLYELIKMMEN